MPRSVGSGTLYLARPVADGTRDYCFERSIVLKLEKAAILTCSTCGVEGEHELLYLSERLEASRCLGCGKAQVYSGHIYSEYARDMVERTLHLPGKLTGEALRNPTTIVSWPFKAIRKPFRLLVEMNQVATLERNRHFSGSAHRKPRPKPSAVRC